MAPTSCYDQTVVKVLKTEGNIPFPEDAIKISGWHDESVK
jgi:hypothetical protein